LTLACRKQQPLIVFEDRIFVKTHADEVEAELRTAAGVRHRFAPLTTWTDLCRATARRSRNAVEALLLAELPRQAALLRSNSLSYFADCLVPAFRLREIAEGACGFEPQPRSEAGELAAIADYSISADDLPPPEILRPSVIFLGRCWRLAPRRRRDGCWQVERRGECYGLTGDYVTVRALDARRRAEAAEFAARIARELVGRNTTYDSPQWAAARDELARRGCVERDDLLYLPGSPARLGYILPPHQNWTFGRRSRRDLAITAALAVPPEPYPCRSTLAVYERTTDGWRPVTLPNGLCWGTDPPRHAQESPGVGLAALLRWAAVRLAENGAFHSADGQETTNDWN